MKKGFFVLILVTVLIVLLPADSKVLNELTKPISMIVDGEHLYVAEAGAVLIYSRKDFSLVKKFGKKGSGPGEFQGTIQRMVPDKDVIWISSMNKLSIFSKTGVLNKEFKIIGGFFNSNLFPVGGEIVGTSMVAGEGGTMSWAVTLFKKNQSQLNKGKVLISYPFGTVQKMEVMNAVYAFTFTVIGDRVYAADKDGFKVHIFDRQGKKLSTFEHSCKMVKFTKKLEQSVRKGMKKNMPSGQYEAMKDNFRFPEYLPAILMLQVSGKSLYALSPTEKLNQSICYIMDHQGKLLEKKEVRFAMTEQMQAYPFFIHQKKLYQVIENEETEDWELVISNL